MRHFLLFLLVLAGISSAHAAEGKLRVAATLSTFADLAREIGGEEAEVSFIASPRFNPHFIEPRPSDVLKVKRADLFLHAGLDLELWRGPLLDAAGNAKVFPGGKGELDLSRGISLLEVPDKPVTRLLGDIHIYGNPHYWLHPENVRIMAKGIAAKLSELDPAHAKGYEERLSAFSRRLDEKMQEWRKNLESVRGKEAIAYHRSWSYLAKFAGLTIEHFLEPKPGVPPTPRHLAFIRMAIEERGIPVLIQESFVPPAYALSLAKETNIQVVTLAQNVGEVAAAKDYFSFMDYNVHRLVSALGGVSGAASDSGSQAFGGSSDG